MRIIAPLLPVLILCQASMSYSGRRAEAAAPRTIVAEGQGGAYQTPLFAASRMQASRLLLEFRHRELRNRLDSLWSDTLRVKSEELPRYRRALRTADLVMVEAESRIGELRRTDPAAETRKWEALRARTERTLFGLDRYLRDAEVYWLPAQEIAPPSPSGSGEDL